MKKILIVEDSNMFVNLLKNRIYRDFWIESDVCRSYEEATTLLAGKTTDYELAILDLTLPGAPDGEIVDLISSYAIPIVVVTGRMNDQVREKILEKQVIDYIIKGPHTLDLLASTIGRFLRNKHVQILLVEDSNLTRDMTRKILENQKFKVIEAHDGVQAMEKLHANPAIKLVLTDFNMPRMNGFELTAAIRKHHPMDRISILGMSAHGNPLLSAQFLKRGANDFINKPYFEEELIWRVNQNVELLFQMEQLRDAAYKDVLTGLFNRRHFFQVAEKLFNNAKRDNLKIDIAMIDIDHFKKINDTHGHNCGDMVIQQVATILNSSFRSSDLVARLGGEEFIVMTSNLDPGHRERIFNELRTRIAEHPIGCDDNEIRVTVSIGVNNRLESTLDKTISLADELLYQAKNAGRNRIVLN